MRILLIQCPCAFGTEMPPLGLSYLSAFLKTNNCEVVLLDLNIILYRRVSEENKIYWDSNRGYCWYLLDSYEKLPFLNREVYEEFVDEILSIGIDVLGFSVQNTSAIFTLEIIKRIRLRDPAKRVILGGPNCYNIEKKGDAYFRLPHDLQKFADVVVVGEGEQTLLNVLRKIDSREELNKCKGIAVPIGEKYIFNGFAAPIADLDDLPVPDYEAYDLESYTNKNALPVMTSRGCIMKCVFCTDTNFWSTYRYRSAENVIAEITFLCIKYDRRIISFNDSLINGNYRKLLEMCNMLIERKLNILWGGNCRIDKRLDIRLLEKMRNSGCAYLILGIESASNKILNFMRKGFTIEEVDCFIHNCYKTGIDIIANWIIGFPEETEEDFMATVNFIKAHGEEIKRNTFSTLTINQFSYLEKHKEEFGVINDTPHLGLWYSKDGLNTVKSRNLRLQYVEVMEAERSREYGIVRQEIDK